MNKHLRFLILIIFSTAIFAGKLGAQTKYLLATCTTGGAYGSGTILVANDTGGNFHVLYDFYVDSLGAWPLGRVTEGLDGKLYGCTMWGAGNGCLYSFDISDYTYSLLHQFVASFEFGQSPHNGLTLAPDGTLYGVATFGGAYGSGTIFSYNPSTTVYKDIYDFNNTGGSPMGELLLVNGTLFGTRSNFNTGTLFSFNIADSIGSVLYNFYNVSPGNIFANLILASDGNLYGIAADGGTHNYGAIYRYNLTNSIMNFIFYFNDTIGYPSNGLVQAPDGKLYGCTYNNNPPGLGEIYSYDITSGNFRFVANLDSTTGYYTSRPLTVASDGNLYGAAHNGGFSDSGTLYKLDIATSTVTVLRELYDDIGLLPDCQITEYTVLTTDLSSVYKRQKLLQIFPQQAASN